VRYPRRPSEMKLRAVALLEAQREGLPRARITQRLLRIPNRRPRPAILVHAPSNFSFLDNHSESLGFIRDVQFVAHAPGGMQGHHTYVVDLSGVTSIGLDAALVLVAEYHRNLFNKPNYQPPIDDADWPAWLRCLLHELGFYKLVKASVRTGGDPQGGFQVRFVPFVSASLVQGELIDDLIEQLKTAAGATPKRIATYGALLEAIKNVRNHAYPSDADLQLPPRVERWWGAGAYDPNERSLTFAMFDQGVGIPATLPKRQMWRDLLKLCPPEWTDADVIEGAIELGRTSTGRLERGNGLWTIVSLVRELPGSEVRILSGRGELTYRSDGTISKRLHANPFCGTLIEWSLILPAEAMSGAAS